MKELKKYNKNIKQNNYVFLALVSEDESLDIKSLLTIRLVIDENEVAHSLAHSVESCMCILYTMVILKKLIYVVAVYQVFVYIYRKSGVEPPTYPEFRRLIKATTFLNKQPGRLNYEDT